MIGDLLATGRLPAEPAALAAALPDLPRWVETRWMLREGGDWARTTGAGMGVVVLAEELRLGAVVGHPDPAMLRRALDDAPCDFSLIVQLSDLAHARAALAGWAAPVLATIHRLSSQGRADAPPDPGVLVFSPPYGELVSRLPAEMRREAPYATAIAVQLTGGSPVSVCQATAVTETLRDAGVQTAEGHRRRGHASACFRALAAYMAAAGKESVWGAEEGNRASIELARKLGFEPVERVAIMRPAR